MPIVERIVYPKGVSLLVWQVTESEADLCQLFSLGYLPEIPKERKNPRRRIEFLVVQLLLRELLGYQPILRYEVSGRPYLADSKVEISISHTAGYIVVAVASEVIGVDVERIGDRAYCVRDRFMNSDEITLLQHATEPQASVLVWSAKESLFKAIASTEIDFKQHLCLLDYSCAMSGSLSMQERKSLAAKHYRLYYQFFPDFVLTLVVSI